MKGKAQVVNPIIQNIAVAGSQTPASSGNQAAAGAQVISGIAGALTGKNITRRDSRKAEGKLTTSDEKSIDTAESKVESSFANSAMQRKQRKEPGKGDQVDVIV
jgi:hypothetical protein